MSIASSMIDRFGREVSVKRQRREGQYVKGEWVPTSINNSFSIKASIQPIDGEQLQQLEEGERSTEARSLWTTTKLLNVREDGRMNADIVIDQDDSEWLVTKVETWPKLLNHFKCTIIRINRQE